MQYARVLQCSRTGLGSAPTCTRVLAAVGPASHYHVQCAPRRVADARAASHEADTTGRRCTQCRAAYSHPAAGTTTSGPAAPADAASRNATFELACPICQDTQFDLRADTSLNELLYCARCARTFNTEGRTYVDLTLSSGVTQRVYNESQWGGVELFRNPLVSLAYEKGWRQSFGWAGFPGPDKEFDMAMDLLRPAHGWVLVDMSCGSGVFTRRFAASGAFAGVVAADYSETMLKQTRTTLDDAGLVNVPVLLLRADVGRLPFATGSVAAIHAGAAIHCWPNPTAAMAEISRVLAPGGVFVASTFLKAAAPLGQIFGDEFVRPLNQLDPTSAGAGRNYRWWEEAELQELCDTVGLTNFGRDRRRRFIMFSAQKPQR